MAAPMCSLLTCRRVRALQGSRRLDGEHLSVPVWLDRNASLRQTFRTGLALLSSVVTPEGIRRGVSVPPSPILGTGPYPSAREQLPGPHTPPSVFMENWAED